MELKRWRERWEDHLPEFLFLVGSHTGTQTHTHTHREREREKKIYIYICIYNINRFYPFAPRVSTRRLRRPFKESHHRRCGHRTRRHYRHHEAPWRSSRCRWNDPPKKSRTGWWLMTWFIQITWWYFHDISIDLYGCTVDGRNPVPVCSYW